MSSFRSRLLPLLVFPLIATPSAHAQWSVDNVSAARGELSGVVHGQKAYFAGGREGATRTDVIDIYDDVSKTWSQATLSSARSQASGVAVGSYVLFAGGAESATTSSNVVDFLDTNTMTWSSAPMLSTARFGMGATTVGSKALFVGGGEAGPSNASPSAVVDVYDSALGAPDNAGAWSTTTIPVARGLIAATTVGDRAFFAGGLDGFSYLDTVDVYDNATGMWSVKSLSQARAIGDPGATTVGSRAYFAGGQVAGGMSDVIDVYDADFDTWFALTLSVPRSGLAATTVGDLAVFAGGVTFMGAFAASDVVDVVASGTGAQATSLLSEARGNLAPAVIGQRALFAGGLLTPFIGTDVVDVFECVGASASTYAGDGINADTIAPVPIVLGQSWNAPLTIGHPHGAGGPTQLKVRTGVTNGANVFSPIGGRQTEVLISGPLLLAVASSHDGASGDIPTVTVPPILDLVGASWAAQYVVVGGGHADLSQAVEGTIGCF
jgi:hypothetical protein